MNPSQATDPFKVLGLPRDAGETEIRARYLELIKQFPPEREPDRFREVRAAFEAASDPLRLAERLIERPDEDCPDWSAAIEAQKQIPPRLSLALVLSLGNRTPIDRRRPASTNSDGATFRTDPAHK